MARITIFKKIILCGIFVFYENEIYVWFFVCAFFKPSLVNNNKMKLNPKKQPTNPLFYEFWQLATLLTTTTTKELNQKHPPKNHNLCSLPQ